MANVQEELQAAKIAVMDRQVAESAAENGIDASTLGEAVDFIDSYLKQHPYNSEIRAAYWISLTVAAYNAGKMRGIVK